MVKKIILLILVLGLGAGGFFYWQNSQADVRELNKTLPEGVRVVKSLFSEEYRVVNKIDGYEFKTPQELGEIDNITYLPGDEEIFGYPGSNLNIEFADSEKGIIIDYFKTEGNIGEVKKWAEDMLYNVIGFSGELAVDSVGELGVVKTLPNGFIFDSFMYFFRKGLVVYGIVGSSEEFIKYIITNGKW